MIRDRALELLRAVSPYGEALENHCLRIAEFSLAIAAHDGVDCDPDLLYAGAYLHDIGLLVPNDDSYNYLYRGLAYVRPHMAAWGLDGERQGALADMLLYNHALRSVKPISPMGDLMRLGVHVEHSFGRWSHGVPRAKRKAVFSQYPRGDFNRVLYDFFKITLKRDGLLEIFRLFFPKARRGQNASH